MSTGPRIGVLALQGDVREHLRALESVGAQPVAVRRADELADVDGLVIPGGESTTIGKLAVTFGLLEPLQKAIAGGLPAYGSCAGMILLANKVANGSPDAPRIGGLDIVVRRNAFGRQVDSFEAEVEMAGVAGGRVTGVFIRAPRVDSMGSDVKVLATLPGRDGGTGTVVAVRQRGLLATAFHPELTGDHRVHQLFVDIVRSA